MFSDLFTKLPRREMLKYTSLRNTSNDFGDEEGLLKDADIIGSRSHSEEDLEEKSQAAPYRQSVSTLVWMNVVLFFLSLTMFITSFLSWNTAMDPVKERNYFLKQTSEPSPILDLIDIPMKTWRLNGTFIDQGSIYRQRPSPEVDAAWERVETQTPIPISREDIIAQGKDPDDSVKWPEEFGFGPDAYIGRIDVFHQIHCLNQLRKHLVFNYDHYFHGEHILYNELHVGHCLHTLLQNLMCNGNVDVYPHFWADAQKNAVPDFSINHKCRDFDAILDWHNKHAVPLDEFGRLRIPDGQNPRIMVHAFKEAFEWYDEYHPDDGDLGTAVG